MNNEQKQERRIIKAINNVIFDQNLDLEEYGILVDQCFIKLSFKFKKNYTTEPIAIDLFKHTLLKFATCYNNNSELEYFLYYYILSMTLSTIKNEYILTLDYNLNNYIDITKEIYKKLKIIENDDYFDTHIINNTLFENIKNQILIVSSTYYESDKSDESNEMDILLDELEEITLLPLEPLKSENKIDFKPINTTLTYRNYNNKVSNYNFETHHIINIYTHLNEYNFRTYLKNLLINKELISKEIHEMIESKF